MMDNSTALPRGITPPLHYIKYQSGLPVFPDVSHWKWIFNPDLMAAADTAKILGMKINQGFRTDPTRQRNLDIAKQYGLIQLGYEYDEGENGDLFLARFPPADNRVPCIDCEATNLTLAETETWVQRIAHAYGRQPVCYGRSWFVGKPIAQTALSQCPFWLSEYGSALIVPAGCENVFGWQFTEGIHGPKGAARAFPGIGQCDISVVIKPLEPAVVAQPASA